VEVVERRERDGWSAFGELEGRRHAGEDAIDVVHVDRDGLGIVRRPARAAAAPEVTEDHQTKAHVAVGVGLPASRLLALAKGELQLRSARHAASLSRRLARSVAIAVSRSTTLAEVRQNRELPCVISSK